MAAEFSGTTRFVATLLLLALSLAAWKWLLLQSPRGDSGAAAKAPRKPKKKSKKHAAAKKAASRDDADSSEQVSARSAASVATVVEEEDDASDDSDDRLSVAQILTKRKFQVKAIGVAPKKSEAARGAGAAVAKFELEQRVLARFAGGREWFPATIVEIRRGNEYHVRYDDEEVEYHVPHALIKPRDTDSSPTSPRAAAASPAGDLTLDHAPAASHASESDADGDDSSDGNDGWKMVGGAASGKTKKPKQAASAAPVVGDGGLTKRQRENRRKKERQKEIKELARAQAQENGLHAKWGGTYSKMKYVPPPTQA